VLIQAKQNPHHESYSNCHCRIRL